MTAAQNAMRSNRRFSVANNANGRINAFVRSLYESNTLEVLVPIILSRHLQHQGVTFSAATCIRI